MTRLILGWKKQDSKKFLMKLISRFQVKKFLVKPNDINPVDLIRQAVGKFYLSEEEITEIIKERYKF